MEQVKGKNGFLGKNMIWIIGIVAIVAILTMAGNARGATINVPADYPTIQDAINASNDGDTIIVAAGTYTEQLMINKSVNLVGQSGAKIVAPNNASRNTYKIQESGHTFDPIIFAYGGTYSAGNNTVWGSGVIHVNISGFEIDGNNDGVGDVYAGIFLRNVEGRIYNNYVHNMHVSSGNPQTFCIEGYGNSNVRVDNNTVMNYTRGGIVFNGDLGSLPDPYAIVENNTVVGNGLSDGGGWAENGIQIGWEASGIVQYNDVSANGWPGGNWAGTGILIAGTGEVTVRNNNVHDNEASISAVGYEDYKNAPCYNITIKNNKVYSNVYGISAEANVNHVRIKNNTIYENDYDGIDIWAYVNMWGKETSYPDNITIQNNKIYNHTYCGIYLSDVYDNISINQNNVHHNGEAVY
ncbi:MAG: right-handed parallel beta-helix repeat-containing protein, partial [Thermoplasmata archaeon]|nr:right-handed parallel beta-helix repeat-containing protein [Thermoplasmata archaeon]